MASYLSGFKDLEIQLEEIKTATNNFDEKKVIGNGGFGKVYKGELTLPEGKSMVAFKRHYGKHGQGDPEFFKEITMLSCYKHDNLISLLGYCKEGDEMILIYEHASQGSLDKILNDANLTWTQRLKICLGAANGLSFLHDPKGTQQRVLHRDIKSANILLDENLNAKVADFGLSKIGPANQQHTLLVTSPVGTPGYCDPQYMNTYQLTKESDVYSFGVVLFEVLCGRVCFEYSNGSIKVFVNHWKSCYEQKKLDEIIFPHIKQQLDPNSVQTFGDIAYQCLQNTREQRPTMSAVLKKLKAALESKKLHDLELSEYREILKVADPPLMYNSLEELKALFAKGFPVNRGKTLLSINDKKEASEKISIEACLKQDGIDDYNSRNESHSHKSRFPSGIYRTKNKGFEVHIRTQFLTPLIDYTVNLVLYKGSSSMKQKYVALRYKLEGETKTSIVYLANETKDNRSYIAELYQFTSDGSVVDLQIVFEDHEDDLKVECILLQPLKKVYEQVKTVDSLRWTMEKVLCATASKWFHIKRNQEGYAMDGSKECLMFSARGVIESDGLYFKSSRESRFREVAVITNDRFIIRKNTALKIISWDTLYAVYLVYKLPQDRSKFETPLTVKDHKHTSPYPYTYLLNPPDTPFIGKKLSQNSQNPLYRPKSYAHIPQPRRDGWMQVRLSHDSMGSPNLIHIMAMHPHHKGLDGLMIEGIEVRPVGTF